MQVQRIIVGVVSETSCVVASLVDGASWKSKDDPCRPAPSNQSAQAIRLASSQARDWRRLYVCKSSTRFMVLDKGTWSQRTRIQIEALRLYKSLHLCRVALRTRITHRHRRAVHGLWHPLKLRSGLVLIRAALILGRRSDLGALLASFPGCDEMLGSWELRRGNSLSTSALENVHSSFLVEFRRPAVSHTPCKYQDTIQGLSCLLLTL
jgi:hypothetical protein